MALDDDEELTIDDLEDDMQDIANDDEASEDGESSDSDEPSWGSTMVVNNTTYAVSLFWQPLQDTNDPYPEVKETVENVMDGADLFCLRSGTSPQYGIGNSTEGHKPGMPSAAAAIAEVFQDKSSSVAVFEVDEGWWFIAIRNDLILSEEDILYLKEEDAKRAFFAMMAVPDWGRKIAPASWEIEGTEEVELWDVLKNPGSSKLLRINKASQKTKLMIAGAGLLVLLIGYKLISGLFVTEKKPVIRPLIAKKPVFEEAPPPVQEKIVLPWEKLVVTEDLINRCQAAVQQLKSMIIPGWSFGAVTCSASGASTIWSMEWGGLGWFKRAFEEYNTRGMSYLLDDAGRSAIVSLSIGDIAIHSDKPKAKIYEVREELNNFFQSINASISLNEEVPQLVSKISKDGLSQGFYKEKGFAKLKFSFSSDLPTDMWQEMFDKISGLEIIKLTYDHKTNNWTYEGQIYDRPL